MKQNNYRKLYTEQAEEPWAMEAGVTDIVANPQYDKLRFYKRPQLYRDSFFSLDGIWDIALTKEEKMPDKWSDTIRVPFPPEAEASEFTGNKKQLSRSFVWYRKRIVLPETFINKKILLHFDAVDQTAEVWVNKTKLAVHEGGYLPFTVELGTICNGEMEIVVLVTDFQNQMYPWGKQAKRRGGMWYTGVTGIWQSVWMECVPDEYMKALRVHTGLSEVTVEVDGGADHKMLWYETPGGREEIQFAGNRVTITVRNPILWSPENPHLYPFTVIAGEDRVESYFALRTISISERDGREYICLNGQPTYFHGVLDQGYFPEGIYTPVSPACYEKDIQTMKAMGFNTLRKHIKVEPAVFYYLCDKLGMIVFQDMVNNGGYSYLQDTVLPTIGWLKRKDTHKNPNQEMRSFFIKHCLETMDYLHHFPSVCYYTVFNEGWGQFCADEVYSTLKMHDESRIIDATSGWFVQSQSDVESFHVYFKPLSSIHKQISAAKRPVILSEFGGYAYKIEEHSYSLKKNYGYRKFADRESYTDALYRLFLEETADAVRAGLNGSIYTQLSDVEDENNGLLTYDRRITKVDVERMKEVSDGLLSVWRKKFENG